MFNTSPPSLQGSLTTSVKADILVVDDTPENLHLLSNILSKRGYKVRSVTKGFASCHSRPARLDFARY
jgi:CheY-like chemotaxis protein